MLKLVDTTKSLSMKQYVLSVVVIKLWTKPISYSIVRDIPRWEIYPFPNDDIRKLSHENLISQLMNSNDYYVNLRLIVFISSRFEMRDKLIWPLLEYWINVMIFISMLQFNYCNYHVFNAFAMLFNN